MSVRCGLCDKVTEDDYPTDDGFLCKWCWALCVRCLVCNEKYVKGKGGVCNFCRSWRYRHIVCSAEATISEENVEPASST
jgi:hypothetical protein